MFFYSSFALPWLWCKQKPQAHGLYLCVHLSAQAMKYQCGSGEVFMQHLSSAAAPCTEDCWQRTSFPCMSQLGGSLQKHFPIKHQGGDLLIPIPIFQSRAGLDVNQQ